LRFLRFKGYEVSIPQYNVRKKPQREYYLSSAAQLVLGFVEPIQENNGFHLERGVPGLSPAQYKRYERWFATEARELNFLPATCQAILYAKNSSWRNFDHQLRTDGREFLFSG
jgi:hypothetical protein